MVLTIQVVNEYKFESFVEILVEGILLVLGVVGSVVLLDLVLRHMLGGVVQLRMQDLYLAWLSRLVLL